MKKLLTGICILATAGVITACGNGGSGQDATTAPQQTTEVATTSAESKETEETTTEADEEAALTVSGEVTAVGMSSITIVTEAGDEISFLKEEAEVDTADELAEGALVTITYTENEDEKIASFITDAIEE